MAAIRGDRIRRLREAKGWTQIALSVKASLTQGHVSRIETNSIESVGSMIVENLASVLGTNPGYLIGTSDDPRPGRILRKDELTPNEQAALAAFSMLPTEAQASAIEVIQALAKVALQAQALGAITPPDAPKPSGSSAKGR